MSRKDTCTVYTINGFLTGGHPGEYRAVVLALDKADAVKHLGLLNDIGLSVSRDTMDWVLYDEHTSIGDIFVTPRGTHKYQPIDQEDFEL